MSSKTIVVITGANTGIGYEAVKAFLSSSTPYHVFVGARNTEKLDNAIQSFGDTGIHKLVPLQIDLLSDESIAAAFKQVSSEVDYIDVLINNAGAATSAPPSRESFLQDYNVNVAGTFAVTDTFLPLLIKSSAPRLLFLTSGLSSFEEVTKPKPRFPTPPAGWPKPPAPNWICYISSKAALNMMMVEFSKSLKNDNVKVWCISPGFLATDLGGNRERLKAMGAGDPALGGTFIQDVVEGARDEDVGKVIRRDIVQPW
ncbi:hypothetical protein TWF696_006196 [Orbilia brochopaga]|uniref:NAD(P)-binding protein n=1 Tax=Orbilia brochopaga TaxID=3140254 RepID=A0AAV9UYT2_9PEZI